MVAPSGTVTFLFTDIEGSTGLWERAGGTMAAALARHDAILRNQAERHGGTIFAGGGDGFAVAFSDASSAVHAAVDAQLELGGPDGPGATELRVRMGIHTGVAEERDGNYFGPALNRCARLMRAAHGGQILCSDVTAALCRDATEPAVGLVDLGEHRLRDLAHPMRVFQIAHPSLAPDFPPLRSLDAYPTNLPAQLASFVGREAELAEAEKYLLEGRLLTLTGVGGVGKTRLALQVAADLVPHYPDGAWLVELGPVGDPASVADVVATALGVQARPGQPLVLGLSDYLRGKSLLLLLDNCEHLVAAVAALVEHLLQVSPRLTVLATSREGLGLAGEHVMPVGPLGLPDDDTVVAVQGADAVRLFVERARDVRAGFGLDRDNAAVVARLCRRLDGIPLALELAGARVRSMAPADILSHLDQRFRLLTGGRRTALSRQQTLRGAIDWSFDLLDDRERAVLGRLAAFAGGFDLVAAEAVAGWGEIEVIDVCELVDRLVDKSLVLADLSGATARYRLLEMIRDYAWERLAETGQTEQASRTHAEHFVAFAARADTGLCGPDEVAWTAAVERDLDNLRAAASWAADAGDVDLALRLIAHLAPAFGNRVGAPFGPIAERAGRRGTELGHPLSCVALASAARSAADLGELDHSRSLAEAALAAAADLPPGKDSALARCRALSGISTTVSSRDLPGELIEIAERRMAAARELDDPWETARALTMLAGAYARDQKSAIPAAREAVRLTRQLGSPGGLSLALMVSALSLATSEPAEAEAMLDEAIGIAAETRNTFVAMFTRQALGQVRGARGDRTGAIAAHLEAAELAVGVGDLLVLTVQLGGIACHLADTGHGDDALVLSVWAQDRSQWPDDWMVMPTGLIGSAELARMQAALTDDARSDLRRRAAALSEAEILSLARTAARDFGCSVRCA